MGMGEERKEVSSGCLGSRLTGVLLLVLCNANKEGV